MKFRQKGLKAFLIEEEMFSFCLAFLSGNINNKSGVVFLLHILKTYRMKERKNASNPEISNFFPF